MSIERKIFINNDLDIVVARIQAREIAKQMGFGTADQARISLAASELARLITWGSETPGEITMSGALQNGNTGVQVLCNLNLKALHLSSTDLPASKANSVAGRSLAGACQLVDESLIEEQNDQLATITLIKWLS